MKPGKSYLNFFFPSKQACIKLISLAALMSSSHKLRVRFGMLACLAQTSIQPSSWHQHNDDEWPQLTYEAH